MAYRVMAYRAMTYIVLASIVMDYILMVVYSYDLYTVVMALYSYGRL